jgi:hypothetical protein
MTLSTASHSSLSRTKAVWGITVRVIVMARQQTPSSKDNDPGCPVWRVRKVVVLLIHYDLVNLTS